MKFCAIVIISVVSTALSADLYQSDEVCALEPGVSGRCSRRSRARSSTQYTYIADEDVCVRFAYSGCGGNANRFSRRRACESACEGFTNTSLSSAVGELTTTTTEAATTTTAAATTTSRATTTSKATTTAVVEPLSTTAASSHVTVAGCPSVSTRSPVCRTNNKKAGALCCPLDNSGECLSLCTNYNSVFTYRKSNEYCGDVGMRLCTAAELASDMCCDSGCNLDNASVWTSDGC